MRRNRGVRDMTVANRKGGRKEGFRIGVKGSRKGVEMSEKGKSKGEDAAA